MARYGGEEFAVILPGASLEEAVQTVERVRKILETNWTIEPNGERVGGITVSFGVTQMRPEETAAEILKRTDERLYDAKSQGRNCVVADTTPDNVRLDATTRIRRAKVG